MKPFQGKNSPAGGALALAIGLASAAGYAQAAGPAYEVWLSDQANTQGISATTPTGTHGGRIWIFDSADLRQDTPVSAPQIIDVHADLYPAAAATTGANVARIHGILPSPDYRHMALNFVASGHLGIVEGASRRPLCLFRTTGTSTGRQNHMSFWTPDGSRILVANQNGRMLERVDVARDAEGAATAFVYAADASLDLVGGPGRIVSQPVAVDMDAADGVSCSVSGSVADNQSLLTPNGAMKQAVGARPLNTVICPIPTGDNRHVVATLGGGGMFVVDVRTSPMAIVAEYDTNIVRAAGCGAVEAAGFMHLDTGTSAPGVSEFSVYRFRLAYPDAPGYMAPNEPGPIDVWQDADNGKVAGVHIPHHTNRDAHGMVLTRNIRSNAPRYLHVMDRVRNNVEVFKLTAPWNDLQHRHEGTYDLTASGACGTTLGASESNDPTPDLGDLSPGAYPDGGRIYVALRGPVPLTVAHAASGSCPGLGIVTLSPDRKSGSLSAVLGTMVPDFPAERNLSDPHAAIVRLK